MAINNLIKIAKQDSKNVVAIFLAGSRLYGCADENSDHDYVIIIDSKSKINDIIKHKDVDIIIQDLNSFNNSKSIFKYECLCSPTIYTNNIQTVFPLKINKKEIFELAKEKSNSDYNKVDKLLNNGETKKADKKLFHSMRIPVFARQLIEHQKIINFAEANCVWDDIKGNAFLLREDVEKFNLIRLCLLKELENLCK
jgi:predicted nucleotidyltransferase